MATTSDLSIEYTPIGRIGTASVTVRMGEDILAVETFNLTKPKQCNEFLKRLCDGREGIDPQDVHAQLLQIAADLVGKPGGAVSSAPVASDQPDPVAILEAMPGHVRAAARAMLEDPNLVKRIVDDIQALGVAGEKELSLTLYVVGTSRLLPQPLATIVQGPSASGKSYVIEKVAKLFPAEAVVQATQMTPQALFHLKSGSLRHKLVVVGERSRLENDETAEATRALREMISSGRLIKLMPMKLGGAIQTLKIEQEGPIAYVESTTLGKIFAEDANRCILVNTDERQEQTRRIIRKLAARYSGGCTTGQVEEIVLRHQALQRMLQPTPIVVPFAERLGEMVAHERVETRRAFPHLVSMIQALALLHQKHRKLDAQGRILANQDDYQLARRLLAQSMERLLGSRVSDPARRFLQRLREWFPADETFTNRDAMQRETGSRSSVYGWLAELASAGLVETVEERRGPVPAKHRLPEQPVDDTGPAALPTPAQLFGDGPRTLGQ